MLVGYTPAYCMPDATVSAGSRRSDVRRSGKHVADCFTRLPERRYVVTYGRPTQSARPVTRRREPLRLAPKRRRWDGVSWWYSTILLIPLLLIAGDALFGIGPDRGGRSITFRVVDQASGTGIAGAQVNLNGVLTPADASGEARFDEPEERSLVRIDAPGYESVFGEVGAGYDALQTIALRPSSVVAATTESATQTADAAVEPTKAPTAVESGVTPEAATTSTVSENEDEDVVASGVVVDGEGTGIRGAVVRAGSRYTRTKRDGSFSLTKADVGGGVVVQAPGYEKQELPAGLDMNVVMERQDIKAVYLNGTNAGNAEFVDGLIQLIEETELNAVVIDTKENVVFYDTQVEFFREADVVRANYDPAALVKTFEDRGIYTIARQVIFNDPLVAEYYKELAIKDEQTGDIWRGWAGDAWVNPFNEELWQPNIDLAVESAGFGFDEIQYDYIRFPSDGDLTRADFGPNYTAEGRVEVLVEFLKMTRAELTPTGAMFAIDIFGIVAVYDDDQGIGQKMRELVPYVDYVCPMVYPSHFDAASIDVGGEPNAFPYETIELSMALAKDKAPGMELKIRPWLQDFSLGEPPYGVEEVRAQIDATDDAGLPGWMMWNAASVYTEDAYRSE